MLNDIAGVAVICSAIPIAAESVGFLALFVAIIGFVVFLDCRRHCKAKKGEHESFRAYGKRALKEYIAVSDGGSQCG